MATHNPLVPSPEQIDLAISHLRRVQDSLRFGYDDKDDSFAEAVAALGLRVVAAVEPAARQPQSDLVARLRGFYIDYDKSQLPDGAEPMPGLKVEDLRKAANRIEALEALLLVQHCNSRPTLSVGECVREGLCACSCGLLLTGEAPSAAAAQPEREAALMKAAQRLIKNDDEERRILEPSCQECTDWNTPNNHDKGPCDWHELLAAVARYDTPATPDAGRANPRGLLLADEEAP